VEPGSLALTLTWDGKQIVAAEVVSTRPAVARALSGLPAGARPGVHSTPVQPLPAGAGSRRTPVPRGSARRTGGRAALLPPPWPSRSRRSANTSGGCCSTGRRYAGQPARQSEFLGWRQRLKGVANQADAAVAGWRTRCLASLPRDRQQVDDDLAVAAVTSCCRYSRRPSGQAHIGAESFAGLPTFAGQPAETGVLARRAGDAAVAGLLAAWPPPAGAAGRSLR
jgi:hypothetical protein